ncbi:hypothetical protein F4824DRAFT_495307 [Ustulina deusta]|nr:hypothetical protein F4824DRAFT_495307 [Ustulina deusta]
MSQEQQALSNLELPYISRDPGAYRRHMQDYHYFLIEGYDDPFGYIHHGFMAHMDWPECWEVDPERQFRSRTMVGPLSANDLKTRARLMRETPERGHKSIREAMRKGKSKLTCNLTYMALLIRHGHINAENEPHLVEICSGLNHHDHLFIA